MQSGSAGAPISPTVSGCGLTLKPGQYGIVPSSVSPQPERGSDIDARADSVHADVELNDVCVPGVYPYVVHVHKSPKHSTSSFHLEGLGTIGEEISTM